LFQIDNLTCVSTGVPYATRQLPPPRVCKTIAYRRRHPF
jgi:hypothetical protein